MTIRLGATSTTMPHIFVPTLSPCGTAAHARLAQQPSRAALLRAARRQAPHPSKRRAARLVLELLHERGLLGGNAGGGVILRGRTRVVAETLAVSYAHAAAAAAARAAAPPPRGVAARWRASWGGAPAHRPPRRRQRRRAGSLPPLRASCASTAQQARPPRRRAAWQSCVKRRGGLARAFWRSVEEASLPESPEIQAELGLATLKRPRAEAVLPCRQVDEAAVLTLAADVAAHESLPLHDAAAIDSLTAPQQNESLSTPTTTLHASFARRRASCACRPSGRTARVPSKTGAARSATTPKRRCRSAAAEARVQPQRRLRAAARPTRAPLPRGRLPACVGTAPRHSKNKTCPHFARSLTPRRRAGG
jgi:hypothetical protein